MTTAKRQMFNDYRDYGLFELAVSLGKVPGWRQFRKFGRNDDVDGNEEMWEYGTVRVLPSSAGVVTVVSSSIQDDADLVGTGAWTMRVEGLDEGYAEISEDFTLNGTANVVGAKSFFRINRAFILTAGSGQVNAGNIDITIGGSEQAFIENNEGQTHQTHYTVPGGHSLIVKGISLVAGTLGNGHMIIESQIKPYSPDSSWRSISAIDLTDGEVYSTMNSVPTVIPEKTEIRQKLIFSGTNGEVTGIIHGFLVDNNVLGL